MKIQDIRRAHLALAKIIAKELIEKIPLRSAQDLCQQKIKVEQYINFYVRVLLPSMQEIVSCQILGEVRACLKAD